MRTAVLAPPQRLTFAEYLSARLEGGYEILDGELQPMAGASWTHQECAVRLLEAFRVYQRATRSACALTAPLDLLIRPYPLRTRQPDVFLISEARLGEAGGAPSDGPLTVGPELVVEILSPSETRSAIREKLRDYASAGVDEVWLVGVATETIEAVRPTDADPVRRALWGRGDVATCPALAGLEVSLDTLFEGLP